MASPFDYKEIGDPTVAGSKWGQTSGTSADVIYPVSQLVDETFKDLHYYISTTTSPLLHHYYTTTTPPLHRRRYHPDTRARARARANPNPSRGEEASQSYQHQTVIPLPSAVQVNASSSVFVKRNTTAPGHCKQGKS